MLQHSRRKATGRWRRWTFVIWIALTFVAAAYVLLAEPFAQYFRADMWVVGVIVPPLMIVLLAIGIGWLMWLMTSSRRRQDGSVGPGSPGPKSGVSDRT